MIPGRFLKNSVQDCCRKKRVWRTRLVAFQTSTFNPGVAAQWILYIYIFITEKPVNSATDCIEVAESECRGVAELVEQG